MYPIYSSSPNGTDKVFATVVHGPMWDKKGAEQPALLLCLIIPFVVRSL